MNIPFCRPSVTGREIDNLRVTLDRRHLCGNGQFTKQCEAWLKEQLGSACALLTHSCTAALEMAAMLADIAPGDEVIMPSFTFVSTANAFVLRGGVPVFVDVRSDTFNLDEFLIEGAITARTKAIAPVHYAGVGCEMDAINALARKHELLVIEDAAQAISASYRGKALGSFGHMAGLSFHETKNVISGEGGALLVNDERFVERAEVIREKGTNRSQFWRGQVDKYTWTDIGSSYLPSEMIAAFLFAQLERSDTINESRLAIWRRYHDAFSDLETQGKIRRPIVPAHCAHNAHMYYLLVPDLDKRNTFIARLMADGVQAVFHYVPLHDAPAGKRYARSHGKLSVTTEVSERLVRLPMWIGLEPHQQRVIDAAYAAVDW